MAKKRVFLVETGEDDPFEWIIYFALGAAGLVALFFAAIVALPIIGGLAVAWWAYKSWHNSDAQVAERDLVKLRAFHQRVETLTRRVKSPDPLEMAKTVVATVEEELGDDRYVPEFMFAPIRDGTQQVLEKSGLAPLPRLDETVLRASAAARNEHRATLYELEEIYRVGETGVDDVFEYICNCVGHLVERMPPGQGFVEPNDYDFTVEIMDVVEDLKGYVELIAYLPFKETEVPTLKVLQDHMLSRMAKASGKTIQQILEHPERAPHPAEDKRSAHELVELYLSGWPFLPLLWGRVAYRIPPEARFEHMHILGGTGHGKTQLLQRFIREDVTDIYYAHRYRDAGSDDLPPLRSLVVMDSQGDLIKNISTREFLEPNGVLGGKVIIIDPTDVQHPPALNMFDLDLASLDTMNPVDREMVYNGTIELYVYLFGALLDAEMTTRQATMFRYVAQLLLEIPGATLDTFRDVLENGESYQPYIEKLDYAAQRFFASQFFGGELEEAKKQVLWRLWGILSNRALADMFNSPKNKIDLFEELQRGTVVLINTSKDFLKSEGSKIFGRFWVAMLAQVALRRAVLPSRARVDTHVYIDEAHEVIDEKAEEILNQARKYRIGLTLAHQNLAQLSTGTRATLAASTSIKMLGGVNEADARAYAGDLRTSSERIMGAKKRTGGSEFVTFVKNHMQEALMLNVGFGTLERMDEMGNSSYGEMRDNIRERYCRAASDEAGFTTPSSNKPPRPPGDDFDLGGHEEL